jgi:hypothetical protein
MINIIFHILHGESIMPFESKKQRLARLEREKKRKSIFRAIFGVVMFIAAIAGITVLTRPAPMATLEVSGAASLKADQEKIEMGDIRLGKTVSASFLLTNVGDETLRITKAPYVEVKEGC